jgi:ABC-type multidrug transport system ATPase subunit
LREDVAAAVVIHQPSAKVFELFDQLILLSKGRCIFSDQTSKIPRWYKHELKFKMPPNHLLTDDLLEKSMNWSSTPGSTKAEKNEIFTSYQGGGIQSVIGATQRNQHPLDIFLHLLP